MDATSPLQFSDRDGAVRVNLRVSQRTADAIERLRKERRVTKAALVLQALGVLQAMHDATARGHYVGVAEDRERLDQVLLGPL